MGLRWVVAACIVLMGCQGKAVQKVALKTDRDRISYSLGQNVGKNLKGQELDIDPEIVARGLKDAFTGATSEMADTAMQAAMQILTRTMVTRQEAQAKKTAEDQARAGQSFLAENARKPGVVALPSGLQYRVIKTGTGKIPKASDTVVAHYRGTLVDGTEFDSSYSHGEPATFPVGAVIPGWQEALQKMAVGSRWQVFIPHSLAYGPQGRPPAIPPSATLIFEMELVGIK